MTPSSIQRTTSETDIRLIIGAGANLDVAPPLFRHFLSALMITSDIPLDLVAKGDTDVDPHHLIEDVGICLGKALQESTSGYQNIARYGFSLLPMDDALVRVALDLSGRTHCRIEGFPESQLSGIHTEAFKEFFHGLARGGTLTLHADLLTPSGPHHAFEALFKGLGLALKMALEPREGGPLSTKGVLV